MFRRRAFLGLLALGACAASCTLLPVGSPGISLVASTQGTTTATTGESLPDVSAPPPEPVAETGDADSLEVTRTRAHLERHHTGLSKAEIEVVSRLIVEEAHRHGLEPGLVLAVIQVESSCYHRAVSPVGAMGLMQLMPATGEELARDLGIDWHGPETLFDPVVNVKLGVAYLKNLSDRFDHVPTALAAYNWGPGRISRRIRRGSALPEVYVKQVMRAWDGGALRTRS
jgi:hypothetical protein